jgi:hypothetical protein
MNTTIPLPGSTSAVTVVAPPGEGPQVWAGAPAAAIDDDGSLVVAYRVREGAGVDHNVIARSVDGEALEAVGILRPGQLGAAMVERPALVRTEDGWRMYVSCATPGSKHWWVGALDAATPEALTDAEVRPVFPGDATTGFKDPVIRREGGRWEAWVCRHPLDAEGAEDRMSTTYATSEDGLVWTGHRTVLEGRPGEWDARGARVTAVLGDGTLLYDGRATAEENWFERTGVAHPSGQRRLAFDARYVTVLPLPDGGTRIWYEARLADESHELRTELLVGSGS